MLKGPESYPKSQQKQAVTNLSREAIVSPAFLGWNPTSATIPAFRDGAHSVSLFRFKYGILEVPSFSYLQDVSLTDFRSTCCYFFNPLTTYW
jgi:hypothetical protein